MARSAIIVDDVPFARKIIRDILTTNRINVVGEASNGKEAVSLYKKLKPDFVTMDVVMPTLGGIEATRQIIDSDKEARVIIVSAMGHEQLLMEAINAGARDYILKPFSPEDLMKAIEKTFVEGDETSPSQARGAAHAK